MKVARNFLLVKRSLLMAHEDFVDNLSENKSDITCVVRI
jgi:hypothetical protein